MGTFHFWCCRCATRMTVNTDAPEYSGAGDLTCACAAPACPACGAPIVDVDLLIEHGDVRFHRKEEESEIHRQWRESLTGDVSFPKVVRPAPTLDDLLPNLRWLFNRYQESQKGDGDAMTFATWLRDELEHWAEWPDRSSRGVS